MEGLLKEAWVLTGPWVLYDGTCPLCRGGAKWFGPMLRRRGFRLETLQSAMGRHFVCHAATEDEMKVVTRSGRVVGGPEAIAYISGFVWWALPLAGMWHMRPLRPLLWKTYRWVAANRHCTDVNCLFNHRSN